MQNFAQQQSLTSTIMEEQFNFDLNLDFLDSSTSNTQQNAKMTTSYVQCQAQSTFDIESLATRIASVNDLAVQLKTAKDEHFKLQKQMQDLSDSAMSIRCLYEREKTEKAKYTLLSKELKDKCDQAESQLTNKTLHFEQLTSKIEQSAEKGPISYNELALRYQRLALQMDEDKLLHYKEKATLNQIQDYIESKKIGLLPAFKKKSSLKKQVCDYGIQCKIKAETENKETHTDLQYAPNKCTQGTQYTWYTTTRGTNTTAFEKHQKEVKTQGTQYISSTTTRGTSTSAFFKKQNIGTNFPEVMPVSIEDILKEMIIDVSPLSPICEAPVVEEELPCVKQVEMTSVGTNTGLKNVRKPIDYAAPSIKHSDSRPPSRNMYDSVKNESPLIGMPTINPFIGLGMTTPLLQNTVAELWNVLGHTIFALLQNGGAPLSPMDTNVANNHVRNIGTDMSKRKEQQRNSDERPNTLKDFFEDEGMNRQKDYMPTTRSTATSPISATELSNTEHYMCNEAFDQVYMNPSNATLRYFPVAGSEDKSQLEANHPVEIQRILLNNNNQEKSQKTDILKKSSRVDSILKLFPEYSHSLQKKMELKNLLRAEKKSKKRTNAFRIERELGIQTQVESSLPTKMTGGTVAKEDVQKSIQRNWKEELFGTSDDETIFSDSSQCLSPERILKDALIVEVDEGILKQSRERLASPEGNAASVESPNNEEFLGFSESIFPIISDEVFCKPYLPQKRNQPPMDIDLQRLQGMQMQLEDPYSSSINISSRKTVSNAKRKRRASRSSSLQSNKIYKINGSKNCQEMVTHSNYGLQPQTPLNVTKATASHKKIPSILVPHEPRTSNLNIVPQPTHGMSTFLEEVSSNFKNHSALDLEPSTMLNLNNTTVTRGNSLELTAIVGKPSVTMFQPLNFEVEVSSVNQEKSPDPLLQDQRNWNFNENLSFVSERPNQSHFNSNDFQSPQTLNSHELIAVAEENISNCLLLDCDKLSSLEEVKPQSSIFQNKNTFNLKELAVPDQENNSILIQHDHKTSNSLGFKTATQEMNTVLQAQTTLDFNRLSELTKKTAPDAVIQDQSLKPSNTMLKAQKSSNSCLISDEKLSISLVQDQKTAAKVNNSPSAEGLIDSISLTAQRQTELLEVRSPTIWPAKSQMNSCLSPTGSTRSSSSDSEADLLIDCPQSPRTHNSSSLDLSLLLQTPKKADPMPQFKTPDSCCKNIFPLSKVLTCSTENLIDDFLVNENQDTNGPKFQIFLDKILDEVAPPLSPISVIAATVKTMNSETESSCDEDVSKIQTEVVIGRKNKRKAPATAAIAVKRSARLRAKNSANNSTVNPLAQLNIPGIQLGKYTKKGSEQKSSLKKLKEVKKVNCAEPKRVDRELEISSDIRMGFFKDLLEDEKVDSSKGDFMNDTTNDSNRLQDLTQQVNQKLEEFGNIKSLQALVRSDFRTSLSEENLLLHVEPKGISAINQKSEQQVSKIDSYRSSLSTSTWQGHPSMHIKPNIVEELQNVQTTHVFEEHKECTHWALQAEDKTSDETSISTLKDTAPLLVSFNECPASPPPMDREPDESHAIQEFAELTPLTTKPTSNSLVSHFIANYNPQRHKLLTQVRQSDKKLLNQLQSIINDFINGLCLVMDSVRTVGSLLCLTTCERLIAQALIGIVKTVPRPESEVPPPVPDLFLSPTIRKLLSLLEPLYQRLPDFRRNLQSTIEQSLFTFTKDIIPLEVLMNLTQFYLATIADPTSKTNPARLFICKCLYFYNQKAIPMIYETLCVYPSVLPKREDMTYDRSDALINTIQCLLMSTYYDMEKTDLKTKQILTKLRKFYNYESFKPPRDEVIGNLMAKIRAGRFKNVSYAFALICKRMEQRNAEKVVLAEGLLPLANEYYHTLSQTQEHDEKIACVLECISFIIKPFSLDTDISTYTNLFGRFLNASERRIIQEAALAALLRTIRFGYVHCFNAIYNFKPNYEPTNVTKMMLQTFVYKKSLDFLKRLEHQAHVLVDTDETILHMYQSRAAPLISDHIIQREVPLRIEIFKGSIDVSAECLRNTDAVIAIEIIEHLYPDVLENVPYNIFGFIQPKLAIFSTPNSDFNVLFTPLPNGFRHHDHKFEWSRKEFKDWALNICDRFPNYRVAIFGVGCAPSDSPDLGPVSQFALFVRKDILHTPLSTELEEVPADTSPDCQYKEIYAVDYPLRRDLRTFDQKIFDEASFYINQYRTFDLYHNSDRLIYQIPFQAILEGIQLITDSSEDLRRVLLANGHIIEDEFVIVPEDDPGRMQRRWSDDSNNDFDLYDEEEEEEANSNNLTNGHGHEGEYEEDERREEEEECWD